MGLKGTWVIAGLAALAFATTGALAPATSLAAADGSIAGAVIDASNSEPIEGIEVCAYSTEESESEEFEEACAKTGADGTYTVTGLAPGTYTVEFWTGTLNYVRQLYDGASNWESADPVTVGAGVTSGIDASLEPGGGIAGRVTDVRTHQGIAEAEVCVEGSVTEFFACRLTGANGEYTIAGLPAGSYTVELWAGELGYVTQYFNGVGGREDATPVSVTVGATTPSIDTALSRGGTISGAAHWVTTGAAIRGLLVCARNASTGSHVSCAVTGTDGVYSLTGIPTGSYKVGFSEDLEEFEDGFQTQFYNLEPTFAAADPISVSAPSAVSGIDARLLKTGESAAAPIVAVPSPIVATPLPKRTVPKGTRCRNGFKKKIVRGKPRCVRRKRQHRPPSGRR